MTIVANPEKPIKLTAEQILALVFKGTPYEKPATPQAIKNLFKEK